MDGPALLDVVEADGLNLLLLQLLDLLIAFVDLVLLPLRLLNGVPFHLVCELEVVLLLLIIL